MADERGGPAEPSEQQEIMRSLARELENSFLEYLGGDIGFDELTFEVFDTLQAVHAVANGSYTVEYVDEQEAVTKEQEDLAQEPAREAGKRTQRRER
jgi:hypothetical protein